MKGMTPALVSALFLALLFWIFDFKFASVAALFTAWVFLVGSVLIDYAKGWSK